MKNVILSLCAALLLLTAGIIHSYFDGKWVAAEMAREQRRADMLQVYSTNRDTFNAAEFRELEAQMPKPTDRPSERLGVLLSALTLLSTGCFAYSVFKYRSANRQKIEPTMAPVTQ